MKKILGFIAGFLLFVGVVHAVSYPDYSNYVNDFTKTLSQDFINKENKKLKDFDDKTTNQIAVAVIETTGEESIEEYGIHLAEKWAPGKKGKDNGVVMLFAMKDRTMRIEVGRGLEGDLTDLESKQIQDDYIVPEFKSGNYEKGIDAGIDQVIKEIAPEDYKVAEKAPATESGGGSVVLLVVILIIVVVILFAVFSDSIGGSGFSGFYSSSDDDDDSSSGSSFGGGSFSGGGASSSW